MTSTFEPSVAPTMVAALDRAWSAIRSHHPEVPEVVVTMGAGSIGTARGTLRLGHFAAGRWELGESGEARISELFVGGEGLRNGPEALLGTLLHEAAHGLAHVREIQDTSRQGRWHNARYRTLAMQVGLEVGKNQFGYSDTSVPTTTIQRYREVVEELGAAIVAFRHPESEAAGESGSGGHGTSGGGRASSNNGVPARCDCGRRIRVATSVLTTGPIVCGLCGSPFEA